MDKGYSKMLISHWVLLNQRSPMFPATVDINMIALVCGLERSEKQWTELLKTVGLKIVKIHGLGPKSESVIEAILE